MKKMFDLLKKCVIVAMICLSISNIMLPPTAFPLDSGISTCQTSSNPDEDILGEIDYD